jgi:hypothetical protein
MEDVQKKAILDIGGISAMDTNNIEIRAELKRTIVTLIDDEEFDEETEIYRKIILVCKTVVRLFHDVSKYKRMNLFEAEINSIHGTSFMIKYCANQY